MSVIFVAECYMTRRC